jgi:hypothetical protein
MMQKARRHRAAPFRAFGRRGELHRCLPVRRAEADAVQWWVIHEA